MRINSIYQPRPQQTALHLRTERFLVDVIHRRFGKTVYAINNGIMRMFGCGRDNARFHYVAPYHKQVKKLAWDYAKQFTANIPGARPNNSELKIDFPQGHRIQLLGADNPDAERGQYSDHVVFDETAQIAPVMWREVFRPMLSDRKGSAHFIGTPKGSFNLFYDLYQQAANLEGWGRVMLNVYQTGVLDPEEVEACRREMMEDDDEAAFEQEYLCSWNASIKGAFYGKRLAAMRSEGRIGRVPHDPTLPVITAWDLGMRDSTAIWFMQICGAEVRAIDYVEYQNTGLPEIIRLISKKPYNYETNIGPHDLKVREFGSGVSRIETALKLGVHFQVAKNIPLMDGIDATRSMLDKMLIDEVKCKQGISALSMYRSEYDEIKRVTSSAPVHDWAEHGASALRYFAVAMSGGNYRRDRGALNYDLLDRMA